MSAIGLAAAVGCADSPDAPTGSQAPTVPGATAPSAAVLSVRGADHSFDAPGMIAGGQRTLKLTNDGQEDHDLRVLRLDEGVLVHQFAQRLHEKGLEAALALGEERGMVPPIGPGETAEAVVVLKEGEYILICVESSPEDGVAHALQGMFVPLTVTASP